jgi:hypothetical protein
MVLFDKAREKKEALETLGLRALESAHRVGSPAYYMDPDYGDQIVREFPDGRRELVDGHTDKRGIAIPARR